MRKKIFTTLLTAVTLLTTLPMNVFAANETFEPKDGDKVTVVASAIVTEDELEELGLDLVISIPTEISLSLNGKTFEGSGEIYADGVMDNDKLLRVNIDETHETKTKEQLKREMESREKLPKEESSEVLAKYKISQMQILDSYSPMYEFED